MKTIDDEDFIKLDQLTNDPYEYAIRQFCMELCRKLLLKYRKGKAEHGDLNEGKPIDCAYEVNQEIFDILNYFIIDKTQKMAGNL